MVRLGSSRPSSFSCCRGGGRNILSCKTLVLVTLRKGEFDVYWLVRRWTPSIGFMKACFQHYADPNADALVDAFEQTADPVRQREVRQPSESFVTNVPASLCSSTLLGESYDSRITVFPQKKTRMLVCPKSCAWLLS